MANTKNPSTKELIIKNLFEKGPMHLDTLAPLIPGVESKTVHSKCLELEHEGKVTHNQEDMIWHLVEGVNPDSYSSGAASTAAADSPGGGKPPAGSGGKPPAEEIKSLEPIKQFEELLKSVGVKPPEVIPTIRTMFFSGDIDSLEYLLKVLRRDAASFVSPGQARTIISFWSSSRGLPYRPEDYQLGDEDRGRGGKEQAEAPAAAPSPMDKLGIKWGIERNKRGDWVPIPVTGGSMTHAEAQEAADRRATIDKLSPSASSSEDEEEGSGPAAATGKGGKGQKLSIQDYLMQKLIDKMVDGDGGRGAEDSPMVAALQQQNQLLAQQLQDMKDRQEQARLDRIEENISALAARNPWDDPVAIPMLRQKLGVGSSSVTDSSPAVQLLKDSTDKMDKNVERLTGLFERVMLKTDALNPETTRTPEGREKKAGELLAQVQNTQHSVELRRRAFGQ